MEETILVMYENGGLKFAIYPKSKVPIYGSGGDNRLVIGDEEGFHIYWQGKPEQVTKALLHLITV